MSDGVRGCWAPAGTRRAAQATSQARGQQPAAQAQPVERCRGKDSRWFAAPAGSAATRPDRTPPIHHCCCWSYRLTRIWRPSLLMTGTTTKSDFYDSAMFCYSAQRSCSSLPGPTSTGTQGRSSPHTAAAATGARADAGGRARKSSCSSSPGTWAAQQPSRQRGRHQRWSRRWSWGRAPPAYRVTYPSSAGGRGERQ